MIRTILISTLFVATASMAQASETRVSIVGKSDAAIRIELNKAAKQVCADAAIADYAPCVRETYQNALDQLSRVKAVK